MCDAQQFENSELLILILSQMTRLRQRTKTPPWRFDLQWTHWNEGYVIQGFWSQEHMMILARYYHERTRDGD